MGANFSEQTYLVNEREAIRIAKLCKLSQREVRFILASSCSVYGSSGKHDKNETDQVNPITDYAKSKINADKTQQTTEQASHKIYQWDLYSFI